MFPPPFFVKERAVFFVKLRNFIDSVFTVMKIPAAVAAVLLLPALWKTFEHYGMIFDKLNHYNLLYFAGGAVGMTAIRIGLRIHRGVAETFEHELTHILFALLTFHPVQSMSVNDYGGGNMSFRGKGNWLIALAPYFFPLASAAMMLLTVVYGRVTGLLPDWTLIGLGLAFGYDACAFAEQIHPQQTDFKVAGYWFSFFFLPAAILLSFGTIAAFAERTENGVKFFYDLLFYYVEQIYLK